MPTCKNCGHTTDRDGEFCIKCGGRFIERDPNTPGYTESLSSTHIGDEKDHNDQICTFCSQENPTENNFCIFCGRSLQNGNYIDEGNGEKDSTIKRPDIGGYIGPVANKLREILMEISQINMALSLVGEPSDLTSSEFCSNLELRRATLLEH